MKHSKMNHRFYFVASDIPEPLAQLLKSENSISALDSSTFSEHSYLWGTQEWVWIVQTFLQLKQAGLAVELVEQPVPNAVCIAHFVTTKNKVWGPESFVVGIRSDTSPMRMREFEVVQSPALLKKENASLMCHWPQRHVCPRDPARENKIETVSYFGGPGGLSPAFYSSSFKGALESRGLSLNLCFDTNLWGNYRDTDLVIAVRNHHHSALIETKPASKLLNAWQAGCVALLGKEPAYRFVGEEGKNYFEVETPEAAIAIIDRLKNSPEIYQRMREAGAAKFLEYNAEAVTQQWIELLEGPVTAAFLQWQSERTSNASLRYLRRYWQAARQWVDHKLFYLPIRSQEMLSKLGQKS